MSATFFQVETLYATELMLANAERGVGVLPRLIPAHLRGAQFYSGIPHTLTRLDYGDPVPIPQQSTFQEAMKIATDPNAICGASCALVKDFAVRTNQAMSFLVSIPDKERVLVHVGRVMPASVILSELLPAHPIDLSLPKDILLDLARKNQLRENFIKALRDTHVHADTGNRYPLPWLLEHPVIERPDGSLHIPKPGDCLAAPSGNVVWTLKKCFVQEAFRFTPGKWEDHGSDVRYTGKHKDTSYLKVEFVTDNRGVERPRLHKDWTQVPQRIWPTPGVEM